ncbi:MAG: ExbD/TolR family protein [Bdellovibrionia bacterium]
MKTGPSSFHAQRGPIRVNTSHLAEINVTPLVDVMLVLLIVFMVSAPLMQQGVHVNLPKADAGSLNEMPDQLMISIQKSKQILLGDQVVASGSLHTKLEAIVAAKPQIEVVIQADQAVSYGFVAQVMAEVKKSGISKVGLATDAGDRTSRL